MLHDASARKQTDHGYSNILTPRWCSSIRKTMCSATGAPIGTPSVKASLRMTQSRTWRKSSILRRRPNFDVFISPHYFYPTDADWKAAAALEADEFRRHSFARRGALTLEGFPSSGADWLERFTFYIQDGPTIVVSPHNLCGPQTNDLVLQLRKRKINLGGVLANMCVESRLRELLEQGFEVASSRTTASPRHPEWATATQRR
jgi:Isochorismatase family